MAQITLLTGENAYALRQEKQLWKRRFAEKYGEENLLLLEAATPWNAFLDEVSTIPFLAERRLVVMEGVPKYEREQMETLPQLIHPSTIILFIDPKPDKRLGSVKALQKVADVKDFAPLTGAALRAWMVSEVGKAGRVISREATEHLVSIVGEEQDTLSQEMAKLCAYRLEGMIERVDVEKLAVPSSEEQIWHLSALIVDGRAREAMSFVRSLLRQGEDPHSLWSILLWLLRSFVAVLAQVQAGQRNPAAIASAAKVPFPTAKALLTLASRAESGDVRAFVAWATDADIDLKTGGTRATADAPQELLALLDSCVLDFCSLSRTKVTALQSV